MNEQTSPLEQNWDTECQRKPLSLAPSTPEERAAQMTCEERDAAGIDENGCPSSAAVYRHLARSDASPSHPLHAFHDVTAECVRQDEKWGQQNHDDATWALIAGEEFGEVSQAILHDRFGGKAAGTVRAELVQLAAVCLQWIKCIDRRTLDGQKEKSNV